MDRMATNNLHMETNRFFPRSMLSIVRAALTKSWWGFAMVVLTLPLVIRILTFNGQEIQVAALIFIYSGLGHIAFCLFGSNMTDMAVKMGQQLTPEYPANFISAGVLLLAMYLLGTIALFSRFELIMLVSAVATALFAASIGLFITNGITGLRLLLTTAALIGVLLIIDYLFNNISNSAFLYVYGQVYFWVNFLLVLLSGIALYRWQLVFNSQAHVQTRSLRWLNVVRSYLDVRNAKQVKGVRTGYLMAPGFLKIAALEHRPLWWWFRFGVIDPGALRAHLFWYCMLPVFVGFGGEISLTFLQLIAIVMMVIFAPGLLDTGRTAMRRLYFQSPGLSRQQFLKELSKFYCVAGMFLMLAGLLLMLIGKLFGDNDLTMESLSLGVIGFTGITMCLLQAQIANVRVKVWQRGVLIFLICVVGILFYLYLRFDVIQVSQWWLAAAALIAYLCMWNMFIRWSRSDIEI